MPASGCTLLQNYVSRNIWPAAGKAPASTRTGRYLHRLLQPCTERLAWTVTCADSPPRSWSSWRRYAKRSRKR